MNRQETVKVLTYIKTAFPNAFKDTKDAETVIKMWAIHFKRTPFGLVMLAIQDIVATNSFVPSIAEVKERLTAMYNEARALLDSHNRYCAPLPDCCKDCDEWQDYMRSLKKCGAIMCPRQISEETKAKYRLAPEALEKVKYIVSELQPNKVALTLTDRLKSIGQAELLIGGGSVE